MKHSLDSLPLSNSFAQLSEAFYSRVQPTPFEKPAQLIHFNSAAAELLDFDPEIAKDSNFANVFTGRQPLPNAEPLAMLYAGHQFGHYVQQLGDGRAIMLGETTNSRNEKWEIQLKGSGQTPYSRDGDGRAVLHSTIREYLCSEAMHGLGIPTTRALCITGSDDEVYREQIETGAMLTRLAPSHVRFGSFEVFFYRNQHDELRILADYVIKQHYPELADTTDPYVALLQAVTDRTARLMAQWQAAGFTHGVMNTDNMSVLGLTLDYGPFGFMEAYEPGFICNHSDHHGRYAFDQQPKVGLFNLSCFAQTLLPLLDVDAARDALQSFQPGYTDNYNRLMAAKLGLQEDDTATTDLTEALLAQMAASRTDYTRFFRALSGIKKGYSEPDHGLRDRFVERERFDRWLQDYRARLRANARPDAERQAVMKTTNPRYVLRNYIAQIAIEKAQAGDFAEIDRQLKMLQTPYDEHPDMAHYAAPSPDQAGDIRVSCSS